MFIMEQKSIFKTSIWKVFERFVDNPLKIHYVKGISRKINLAPTSVKKHLEDLEKNNILIRKKGERFIGFIANRESDDFIFYKRIFNLIKIKESGLIDYLVKSIYPKTIVLYGSYLKGEDVDESDIDLLVITKTKKNLNFDRFEKKLERKIHVIYDKNLKRLNEELKLEVMNGLVLYGYMKYE